MGMLDIFKRKPAIEQRSAGGFTAELIAARAELIGGARGVADLTATVQSCVSLWEGGFALADVQGSELLTRRNLALAGRALALRGEAVFLIRDDGLKICNDWDVTTRDGVPRAYRVSLPDAGGGETVTALAAEVLHFRVGSDPVAPWAGQSPLRRAPLTAAMLHAIESALQEVYATAPLGSQIIPFPESNELDLEKLGRGFRGRRGSVMLRESVNVTAAGGAAPSQDWKPQDVSPDLQRTMATQSLEAARDAICCAYGVLPSLFASHAQGPLVREAQRHLAGWTLQPIAMLIAEEATAKLGGEVEIDVMRPPQAYDVGGRARALGAIIDAMAKAKEGGLSPDELNTAMTLVNWGENDGAA